MLPLFSLFLGFLLGFVPSVEAAVEVPEKSYLKGLTWVGHSSLRLSRAGKVIYFDPWKIAGSPHDADLILITHPHFDHCDPLSVLKIAKEETVMVTVADVVPNLQEAGFTGEIRIVKPGTLLEVNGIPIEVVPAYNANKDFHPKSSGWVGFIVTVDETRYYHAGDTDLIPEMSQIRADVAFLPVSGTYAMTAEEAAQAAQTIRPRVAVPIHYGSIVGSADDAERFSRLCGPVIAEILERVGVEQ